MFAVNMCIFDEIELSLDCEPGPNVCKNDIFELCIIMKYAIK